MEKRTALCSASENCGSDGWTPVDTVPQVHFLLGMGVQLVRADVAPLAYPVTECRPTG